MKKIPEQFQAHLDGEVTTVCRCWLLETEKGDRLGFTDHDQDILLESILCQKNAGVEANGIEERIGLDIDSSGIAGALQSDVITASDIKAGRYDNARVSTYIVNWSDPTQFILDRVSLVGEITFRDSFYTMELRGLASQLDQTKGDHFIPRCQADLGDERCKFSLKTPVFSASGFILEVQSQIIIDVSDLDSFETGWFRGGRVEWLTGDNQGRVIEVAEHTISGSRILLHLWQKMPQELQIGDSFSIRAGCDKDFQTCKSKFANQLNFRGFPHIPGNDETLMFAPNQDNFDGGPIIP